MVITKSDFLQFYNCPKQYWLSKHASHLASPLSDLEKKNIESGVQVGALARSYFPDTVCTLRSDGQVDTYYQLERTKVEISKGTNCIAEASFKYEDLYCAVDLLKRNEDGTYSIYEVKATSAIKSEHYEDVAFQKYVLEKCGLKITHILIMHLNSLYVREGDIDVTKLLKAEPVDLEQKIQDVLSKMDDYLTAIRSVFAEKDEYSMPLGVYCCDCPFHNYCHKDIPVPSALNINGLRKEKAYKYINDDIFTFSELLEAGFKPSNNRQKAQIDAVIFNKEVIKDETKLIHYLKSIKYPIYHLDFETMNEAIPPFSGSRPFEQIPFQYSLHIEHSQGGKLDHKEFLGRTLNCKRELAEQLVEDIPLNVTSLAFHASTEKNIIKHLAEEFPDLAERLMNIHDNMIDLLEPFKQGIYYDIKQGGSNSIKYVMPALRPDMAEAYHELPIVHNGGEALAMFPKLVNQMTGEEYETVRKGMLSYCELDTLSMVVVLNKLWDEVKDLL